MDNQHNASRDPETSTGASRQKPATWPGIIAVLALAVFGLGLWGAGQYAAATQEREDLALHLSRIGGHQTCKLAWHKAVMDLGGRTPDIYAPELKMAGPPKVVSCGMIKNGKPAEPLTVIVRCDRLDLKCVDPQLSAK